MLSPLGRCQTISVDLPGKEPVDFDNITENTRLLGDFTSKEERKRKLTKPRTASEFRIDSRYIYTFETYDHMMDFGTFRQHIKNGYMVDLVPSLNGQSLSLGMYTRHDLTCIYKFSLWHERQKEQK